MVQTELELSQALLDEYWNNIYGQFHDQEENPSTITHEKILEEILDILNEYIANIADTSISITDGEYDEDKYGKFINELFKNFIKNYSPQKSFEDNAYNEYITLKRKYIVSETPNLIKKEDLLPGTKALYGIEFESIIVDTENANLICIKDDRLYDNYNQSFKTADINEFIEELPDWEIKELFEYHASGLSCHRYRNNDKRLEFASDALSPTNHKPSELFNTLEKIRDSFYGWAHKQYYLPDHGTISLLSDDKKVIYTTVTGGTHMTISFPLTIHDNPVTWKYFMWLFIGLVTMYQPIYIALNGAPSSKTKGSERQRTSGSLLVGSAYIYNIFTPESGRYEIFINSPSEEYGFKKYPSYAHWYDKDLVYDKTPWLGHTKSDIGISKYTRSDSFKLIHNNSFIIKDKEKILYKQFFTNNSEDTQLYDNLIGNLASMTSNLIEFRFFDNEPTKDLLNKFNLLVRMSDYAYEQSKNMEESTGIHGLSNFLEFQIDDRLNIRPLVNTKAWHDTVLESMNEGMDTTFKEEFIDECYRFLDLTQFSTFLENPELKKISAIDLNKAFVDEMNTAEHHFSEYFQTDNPTSDYSKKYQIQQLRISKHTAEDKKKAHEEKVAKEIEEEKVRKSKIEEDRLLNIAIILDENLLKLQQTNITLYGDIINYIDKKRFINDIKGKIYYVNNTIQNFIDKASDIIDFSSTLHYDEISFATKDKMITWFRESLLPDLREKEPKLKEIEDALESQRERDRRNASQLQREREAIEQKIMFIQDIIVKNMAGLDNETLYNKLLENIHLRKLSALLKELIYDSHESPATIGMNAPRNLYVSTLENISWNDISTSTQDLLIIWFRDSLVPDLVSNIQELQSRSIQTTSQQSNSETQIIEIQKEIRHVVEDHLDDSDINNIIYYRISFAKLSKLMQDWIYNHNYTTTDIRDRVYEIIEKTKFNDTNEEEDIKIIFWIKGILIDILKVVTPIRETRAEEASDILNQQTTQTTQTSDQLKLYILNKIQQTVENIDDDSTRRTITDIISFKKLAEILYTRIYEHNQSFNEIEELSTLIIKDSIQEYITPHESDLETINEWFKNILIPEIRRTTQLNIMTRDNRGVLEHRHYTNDYWHPVSRVHPSSQHGNSEMILLYAFADYITMNEYIEVNELPEGFKLYRNFDLAEQDYYNENPRSSNVTLYKINIASNDLSSYGGGLFITSRPTGRVEIKKYTESEEPELAEEPLTPPEVEDVRAIYDSILKSIPRVDENAQRTIKNYIDILKLTNEIYIRIKDDYSTEQIKGMASLITQTSIYDNTSIPDTKKQVLDSWFEYTLITQLISDNILNPIELTGLSVLFD